MFPKENASSIKLNDFIADSLSKLKLEVGTTLLSLMSNSSILICNDSSVVHGLKPRIWRSNSVALCSKESINNSIPLFLIARESSPYFGSIVKNNLKLACGLRTLGWPFSKLHSLIIKLPLVSNNEFNLSKTDGLHKLALSRTNQLPFSTAWTNKPSNHSNLTLAISFNFWNKISAALTKSLISGIEW